MSIKDLFSQKGKSTKAIVAENAATASQYVESVQTVKAKYDLNNQFVPHVDFSTASNFAKFGSAELYYEYGFKRIYNEYPYDGTEREKIEFRLSSSYLDDYIFENLYPRVNGYVQFSAQGTPAAEVDGYGTPTTAEYILTKGGPHTASGGMIGETLKSKFGESNYYDSANDLGSSLEVNFDQGVSVEFWLKKSSWDTTNNHKEVIFDLWNYEASSSADYGRLTIGLTASADGTNPFSLTVQSGTNGFFEYTPVISGVTTASVGDNLWHHYAFTFTSQSAGIETKVYIDGVKKATDSYGSSGIGNLATISGNLSTIGGVITAPSGTAVTVTGSGKLNAYMDEFRYWKKSRTDKQIANSFFVPLGGGNNENDYNRKLGVYYKFNEGITGTDSTDSVVLDYSGRIANGVWTGYTSSARSTNSAMVESGYARSEFKDPIIYSYHPDVVSTLATLTTTGSLQDNEGTSKLISLMPGWLQEEDSDIYNNQIKKFLQILASYFDNLNAQIGELSSLRDEEYPQTDEEPYFFAKRLVESRGLVVPDFFTDGDLINYLLQKDDNEIFEQNISDVKNRIYHNIYNNLTYILKSKGTEKSFRNLLRCFGIDSEVVRLSLYADDGTYVIKENYEDTSIEKKFLNLNNRDNFEGTIYNVSSSDTNFTYISSSEGSQEEHTAMTLECETFFPLKLTRRDDGYFETTFLTSSIYGFHRALTSSASDYTWHSDDTDIQVYAVRNEREGKDGYFVLTSSLGFEITSSTYFNLYDNNKWNFAVRVRNEKYPYTSGLSGSTGADYLVEFVGYNSIGNYVQNNFSLSSSITNAVGKQLLCNSKRLYAGAHRTNFTGSTLLKSDVLVSDVKFWQSYLDDETIKLHSYNPDNVGTKTPFRPDNVNVGIENLELTDLETLALHWRMDTQTTSDSSGEFTGFDFASGSTENASRNSWLGGVTGHKYPFKGEGFVTSSAKAFDKRFIYSAKQRKFGVLMSSDGVTIKNDANTLLFTDDDVSDNFYAFEKSYSGVISEEMLKLFASLVEFNDLVGQPIDGYKRSYKEMEKLSRLFFEKVENRIEPEKFFDFYRWIDNSIMFALKQLFPASAKYSDTSRNIIESHLLERNKYDRKFPLLVDVTATEGYAKGISELLYNWKFGHAPVPAAENENCLWQKHRKERTDIADRQTILDSLNNGNNIKHLAKITKDGTIYAGSTYALRNFTNLSKFSVEMDKNYHGGTNYSENKNRDAVWDATYIHGPTSQNYPKGIPQNVLVVGLGEGQGTEAFIDCVDEVNPNEKRKWRFTTVTGRKASTPDVSSSVERSTEYEYQAIVKGETHWPSNLISASVTTGYQSEVVSKFKEGVVVTNLHSDTYAPGNEIGMQGPFTETWVGGHQSRHVPLNSYIEDRDGDNARGAIVIINQPSDGEQVVISDGVTSVTFFLKSTATANNHVQIGSDAEETLDNFIIKINNFPSFKVTASKLNFGTIDLINDEPGVSGNVPMTDTLVFPNRVVLGMSGGTFEESLNGLDDQYTRPEGWRLLLKECPDPKGFGDGAMGLVGPDYGGPYPDTSRKYAVHYREERAKRPVNVKNIRTTTSSVRAGNFIENYEVFNTTGRLENRRGSTLTTASVLSPFYDGLPQTTQEASLIGVASFIQSSLASGSIILNERPEVGDTVTIGDGVIAPRQFTFVDPGPTGSGPPPDPATVNTITRGADASATLNNVSGTLNYVGFNFTIANEDPTLLIINNNNIGEAANVAFLSNFSTSSNGVEGLSGAVAGQAVGGNVVMNFNNTNRIPNQIKDQEVYDANVRSNSIIATRFSAPGGFETMSEVYLDIPSKEYSAYNAMPFRNLMVRGSGSGEDGTIRLNDIHGNRFGLQTHLRRHAGQFGFDSVVGSETTKADYVTTGSFHKINRNRLVHLGNETKADYTPATSSQYDNGFVTHQIPRSDYQYSWITNSVGSDSYCRFYGFAPYSGLVSSSNEGYVNAYCYQLQSGVPIFNDICELNTSIVINGADPLTGIYYPFDTTNDPGATFTATDDAGNIIANETIYYADGDCGKYYAEFFANNGSGAGYFYVHRCGIAARRISIELLGPKGNFELNYYRDGGPTSTDSFSSPTGQLTSSFALTQSYFDYDYPQFFLNASTIDDKRTYVLLFNPDYDEDGSPNTSTYITYSQYGTNFKLLNLTGGTIYNDLSTPSNLDLEKAVHYTASYSYEYDMSQHHRDDGCPNISFTTKVSGTLLKPIYVNNQEGIIDTEFAWFIGSGSTEGLSAYSSLSLTGAAGTVYSSSIAGWDTQFSASQSGYSTSDWSNKLTASLQDFINVGSAGIEFQTKLSSSTLEPNSTSEVRQGFFRAGIVIPWTNADGTSVYPARVIYKNNTSKDYANTHFIYYRKGRGSELSAVTYDSGSMVFDQGNTIQSVFTSSNADYGFGIYELQYSGAMTAGWIDSLSVDDTTFATYGNATPGSTPHYSTLTIYLRLSASTEQLPYDNLIGPKPFQVKAICDNSGTNSYSDGADGNTVNEADADLC